MIEVENLGKRFGKTQAVAGLSFRVEPGKITGFLGPNGAGKSTTLRSILGLVHPDTGEATVLGVPYRELQRPLHRVGAVLEASEVHPGRSGRNHLRVLAAAAGLPRSRVEDVLALVELSASAKRRVKGYSLGMRQRLGLAAALLGDPEVLVLDEPANGLDPAGIRWLRDLLQSLAGEGRTILVSAGFDAHEDDPLALMRLTEHGFRDLSARCSRLAPRVCAVLEGGYNLRTLPRLVEAALEGFES